MADIVSPEKRSLMMSGIRGKNTRPEVIIRRALHKRGFRFRLHNSALPGKPDMVLSRYRAIIFIHGCFWHGHNCSLFKWPSTRVDFWKNKITRNRENDARSIAQLKKAGWRVLVIWECATKGREKLPLTSIVETVAEWLPGGSDVCEIRGNTT